MSDKLAVIILDALDTENIRELGLEKIEELYMERNSDVLGISTLPHTAFSNPMIWGGYRNTGKVWVKNLSGEWSDPAQKFNRGEVRVREDAELWRRNDFETFFIWDILDRNGFDASAIQIPIVLPPYSFNIVDELEDSWFPHMPDLMETHIRRKPEIIKKHAEEGRDFIASSIQMPDKWLHGIGEGKCDREFVNNEAEVLDEKIAKMIEFLEEKGYDWMIFGDHGSPYPGSMPIRESKQLICRHQKESVIITNMDECPSYTEELFPFFLDYFGVENIEYDGEEIEGGVEDEEEVKERLEALGYNV